jgi:2-keto-4-pentenoate hydratase
MQAVDAAANFLVEARIHRGGPNLPDGCQPQSVAEALQIQSAAVKKLGDKVAGWKVAIGADDTVMYGAMVASRLWRSPAEVPASLVPLMGVEAEIAFRADRDLPARSQPYGNDELREALTAFTAIEIVDTRFASYQDAPFLDRLADFMSNGGFVIGEVIKDWQAVDFRRLEVSLAIDQSVVARKAGGLSIGDPLIGATALVNAMRQSDGVRFGQVITCGTFTGLNFAAPGQQAEASFEGLGTVRVRFGQE